MIALSGPQCHSASLLLPLLIGKLKIEEHNNACFRIETGKRYDTHPYRNAHVVVQKIQEPEGTTSEKGTASRTMNVLVTDLVLK